MPTWSPAPAVVVGVGAGGRRRRTDQGITERERAAGRRVAEGEDHHGAGGYAAEGVAAVRRSGRRGARSAGEVMASASGSACWATTLPSGWAATTAGAGARPRSGGTGSADVTREGSRSATPSCAARIAALLARSGGPAGGRAAARRRARDRPAARHGAPARRPGRRCRRRSSRCCARSPPSPTRVFTKDELLRTVWGFQARPARRGRSTRTRAGCAEARAPTATASWSTCGASATACSTGRWRRDARWLLSGSSASRAARLLLWRELRRRGELVARACHELRGPLTAAHLALHAGAPRGGALPAALARRSTSSCARAGRALDDLAGRAPRRGVPATRRSSSTSPSSSDAQAAAWEAVAPAYGRELRSRVEPAPRALVRGDRVRLAQAVGEPAGQRLRARRAGRSSCAARPRAIACGSRSATRARACPPRSPSSPRRPPRRARGAAWRSRPTSPRGTAGGCSPRRPGAARGWPSSCPRCCIRARFARDAA